MYFGFGCFGYDGCFRAVGALVVGFLGARLWVWCFMAYGLFGFVFLWGMSVSWWVWAYLIYCVSCGVGII